MHQYSIKEVVSILNTDPEAGLSEQEAEKRLLKYGPNSIAASNKRSLWSILISQFKSPIVFLLLFAIAMSAFFKDWLDTLAILAVLLINALIGFLMEFQAHRSMEALRNLSMTKAKVIRGKHLREVATEEIVPGDLLFTEAGDMIPADARIVKPYDLQADESALTGESIPIEKNELPLEENILLPERANMLYKGTIITRGNARAVVSGTGMLTELGKIASMVQGAGSSATPIERKLDEFSKKLIKITVGLVVLIFIVGIGNGHKIFEMLQTSIALAVAAIPEGLPIVATLALGQGMLKMARHHVIVKKLAAVETLGGTNIICTDKTGTLTQNKIEVGLLSGPGFHLENTDTSVPDSLSCRMMLRGFVLCNNASISGEGSKLKESGDPLETGLLKFAERRGIRISEISPESPRIFEEPFSSEKKIMSTLHKEGSKAIVFSKGAIEELLKRCSYILKNEIPVLLDEEEKLVWIKKGEELAFSGLRILAFAFREANVEEKDLSRELIFTGIAGLLDPLSEGVIDAIKECQAAGIKVVMITGDHPNTAKNIGLRLGLLKSKDDMVIHGKAMKGYEELSQGEKENWKSCSIFARVSPKQKLDLVTVLQENQTIVAMTGDGINDTPALKKADIGIAMGLRGTQAAQEVMILKDDSFASIVIAIRQGRIIFSNIRKFVIFLLSCNLSEIFIIATAAVLNMPFQLLPLQILFINIITDVLPALALGVSPGDKGIMQRMPRDPDSPILSRKHWKSIFIYSAVISIFSIGAVYYSHFTVHRAEQVDAILGNNILFFTLIFSQLLHVFNMTSRKEPFMNTGVFKNKYVWYALCLCLVITVLTYIIAPVKVALGLHIMTWQDWSVTFIFSILSLCGIQLMKKLSLVL
jgi:P-type Ca2+ transporter type 2C